MFRHGDPQVSGVVGRGVLQFVVFILNLCDRNPHELCMSGQDGLMLIVVLDTNALHSDAC